MLPCVPAICLQRATYSMYSHPSQLQGGLSQSMTLLKYSRGQAVSYHASTASVSFSPKKSIASSRLQNTTCFVCLGQRHGHGLSVRDHILNVELVTTSRHKFSSVSWNSRSLALKIGGTCTTLSFAIPGMANADGPVDSHTSESSTPSYAHGKKVYTEYSVTGIPGDGRCLFRSVAHGACIRSGKPIPNEDLQRKLADDLRISVADEFIKRRAETEWFIEGHFDTYVSQIRKPHVWGGEPELLMASHILQMPITVYMREEAAAGGLIAIAEYGQEYGKEDPVQVLYHGYGHYEALQIPGNTDPRSRL
uniref:Uncharacterized protein n=1 Tax=Avena sativa TaxID=4498 RepID=A0ACD5XV19_AVESA